MTEAGKAGHVAARCGKAGRVTAGTAGWVSVGLVPAGLGSAGAR